MAFHWKDWFQEQHHKHKKKKKRRREDEPWRMRFDCEDCNSQSGKPAKSQNSIKIHQHVFFKKKAFRRFFSFARSSIPRPEEEKSEESEHARRRCKVAESDWNVRNKKQSDHPIGETVQTKERTQVWCYWEHWLALDPHLLFYTQCIRLSLFYLRLD